MTPPMTPREKVELKPCPFCGGDAVAGSNFDNDHYVMCAADCDKCGGMVGYMKTEMAAIENWNRRTALASGSGDQIPGPDDVTAPSQMGFLSALGEAAWEQPPHTGSGDHAELARLAEAATRGPWIRSGCRRKMGDEDCIMVGPDGYLIAALPIGGRPQEHAGAFKDAAFIAAANPATVLALLAENAALLDREKAALKECSEWARQAGEAKGRLETSELAGIVEGWRDRATEAERKLAEAVGLNERAADLMRQCTDPQRFEGASTLNVYANMRAWLSDLPPAPGAEA